MPLKVRIRPGERIVVNGVVMRNPGPRATELEILNHGTILHERDIMLPEQATTPLHQIYFLFQAMHLEEGDRESAFRQIIEITSYLYIQATNQQKQDVLVLVADIVRLLGMRDYIAGMRRLHKMIGRPGDDRSVQE